MNPKANIVVLACGNAVPEQQGLQDMLAAQGLRARIIAQPCSSKVETYHILRILATGAALVWVIGCPEEYCQLVEGSSRMGKRVAHAQDYLRELGLEPERVGLSRVAAGDKAGLSGAVADIQSRVQVLGPSRIHPAATAPKE